MSHTLSTSVLPPHRHGPTISHDGYMPQGIHTKLFRVAITVIMHLSYPVFWLCSKVKANAHLEAFDGENVHSRSSDQPENEDRQVQEIAAGCAAWPICSQLGCPSPMREPFLIPPGLNETYDQMMRQINRLGDNRSKHCKRVLLTVVNTHRPLWLSELVTRYREALRPPYY